jgi:magnesium-protoporphyrin IX monomethyl ester (oxidative) cyclase
LFRFFESWCQDENRHGDFFAAILKSQKSLLNTYESKLWCKFFLLSVFATMYLNDLQRKDFYSSIGLDAKEFDKHVIRKTNQSARTLFPIILDTEHSQFFPLLDLCAEANDKIVQIDKCEGSEFLKAIQKINYYSVIIFNLLKIYFLPAIQTNYSWTLSSN